MEETESSWPSTRGPLFPGPGPGTPATQQLLQTLTSLHLKRAIKQDTAHFQIQEGSAEKNLLISTATMANNAKNVFSPLSSIFTGQIGALEGLDEGFLEELQRENVQGLAWTERVLVPQ